MACPVTKKARFDTDAPYPSEASPAIPSVSCSPRKEWQTHMPSAICIDFVSFLDFRDRNAFGGVCRSYRAAVIQCGGQEILQAQRGLSSIATDLRANENPVLTEMADTIEKILSSKPPGRGLNNPRITHQRRMLRLMGLIHNIFTARVDTHPPTPYTAELHRAFRAELIGAIKNWDVIRLCLKYFGASALLLAHKDIRRSQGCVLESIRFCRTAPQYIGYRLSEDPTFLRKLISQAVVWHPHLIQNQIEFAAYQKRQYENPTGSSTENETSIIADTQPAIDLPLPLDWNSWPQHALTEAEMKYELAKAKTYGHGKLAVNIKHLYPDWVKLLKHDNFIQRISSILRTDTSLFADLARHPYLRSSFPFEIPPESINEQFLLDWLDHPFEPDTVSELIARMRDPKTKKFRSAMTDNVQVKFMCLGRFHLCRGPQIERIIKALYPDRSLPEYSLILRAFFSLVVEEQTQPHENLDCGHFLDAFLNKQLREGPNPELFCQIFNHGLDPYPDERSIQEEENIWSEWPTNVTAILQYVLLRCIPNIPENKKKMEILLEDCLNGHFHTLKGFLLAQQGQDKRT